MPEMIDEIIRMFFLYENLSNHMVNKITETKASKNVKDYNRNLRKDLKPENEIIIKRKLLK